MVKNIAKPSPIDFIDFPIPEALSPLIQELSEIYTPESHGVILAALTELISVLKYPNPTSTPNFISSNLISEKNSSDDDVKSWEDLLNFTVYVDTEIYSPNESDQAIADPESSSTVMVIAHAEATDAYVQTWDHVATKLQNPPQNLSMRFWSTAEAANILGCSEGKLRNAKKSKNLPLEIGDFIVDCPDLNQNQKKLAWLIRLKSPDGSRHALSSPPNS